MRYYYDDPLAAAWMAKHFGMKFNPWYSMDDYEPDSWGVWSWENGDFYEVCSGKGENKEPWAYIHPDSLALLSPQDEDVIAIPSWPAGKFGFLNVSQQWIDENMCDAELDGARIIMRNGIPFHYPLEEK